MPCPHPPPAIPGNSLLVRKEARHAGVFHVSRNIPGFHISRATGGETFFLKL